MASSSTGSVSAAVTISRRRSARGRIDDSRARAPRASPTTGSARV